MSVKSVQIDIEGVVQGVGFRPFVVSLAKKIGIKGEIKNTPCGVRVIATAESELLSSFVTAIGTSLPPLAKIDSFETKEIGTVFFDGFEVAKSEDGKGVNALFPPDLTICDECKKELFSKENSRHLYPLINCQNCGPRFTVIKSLPYDRKRTSMQIFEMCDSCKDEYKDPLNRRFHAEPISCPNCGPTLFFADRSGNIQLSQKSSKPLEKAAGVLANGGVAAIKGVGGFHLLCRADDGEAVRRIRHIKKRESKPFAVMFGSISEIKKECDLTPEEEAQILSKERPIVIVKKSKNFSLSKEISGNSPFLGVFLPYSGIYEILFSFISSGLVATSANLSDEPIITDEKELFLRFGRGCDGVVYFDREIVEGCDDSVVRVAKCGTVKIRNSRGFAPSFFRREGVREGIFCAGAHQKNCFAVTLKNRIALSAHIGDLGSLEAMERYEKSVEHMRSLWGMEFCLAVCDKNDRYASSSYAASLGVELLRIQHHKAHFLSLLFEYDRLSQDAISLVWDGTGLGDDGSIWGGELFLKEGYELKRVSHLPRFKLFGGESVAKEPKKSALSLALSFLPLDLAGEIAARLGFRDEEFLLIEGAFKKNINCIETTSAGRLFDAVAALLGVVGEGAYEGESGLMLEALYDPSLEGDFGDLSSGEAFLEALLGERDKQKAATRFINSLASLAANAKKEYALELYCSGGVFQNSALVDAILKKTGGKANFHRELSPNDSSLALGQAAFATLYLEGKIKNSFL